MQQTEILSLAEQLIPAYQADDFDFVLSQLTEGHSPAFRLLVKMELNRIMAPCSRAIDLRGRVQGECREYLLDGLSHWLDDVAFNAYHKNIKKFGAYTEGVWEAMQNTHNNFRIMQQRGQRSDRELTSAKSPYELEPVTLGYDLKRKENRLKLSSQVEIILPSAQLVHGVSVDLSASGARFKVPTAFNYKLGEIITVQFVELSKSSTVDGIAKPFQYRVVGIDDSYDNDAVKFLRTIRLTESKAIELAIIEALHSESQRARHDNQDKIIRARTRGFEHTYLKHTCNLPLFFSGNELKLVLMTENNQPIWQYWHDERNQQALSSLFNAQRMDLLTRPGMRGSNNMLYSFTHEHQDKSLFFSMMMPEATREERQLFWHVGAKRESWKAFRLSVFELSEEERQELSQHATELSLATESLTHCGILQEIANHEVAHDYLLSDKPRLDANALKKFCHSRQSTNQPLSLYFDARSRRKEPRYQFQSPLELRFQQQFIAGSTLDISKRGLFVDLTERLNAKVGDKCYINFHELQLYDKELPLTRVPYRVIRISPEGRRVQLVIEDTRETAKTVTFLNRLIEHNLDKLTAKQELLPSNALLESLHHVLLDKMVCSPIFVEKRAATLCPRMIGVNYPLQPYLALFAKLGHDHKLSLEPVFKGRSSTLLSQPMKRIDGAEPQYHEIYLAAIKFGSRIQSVQTKLLSEFTSTKERIEFIKNAQNFGEFYALRLSGVPVFDPMTELLRKDIAELAPISLFQARTLEKDINAIAGYGEIVDITEEVLIRLELTR